MNCDSHFFILLIMRILHSTPFSVCRYPYFAVVLNFSQYWALYCLVEWYTATKDELAHIKPLAKFLSFKSIVFLTWWQGVIIAIMYSLGLVRSPLAQSLELKSSIQDFIICIEVRFLFKLDRLPKLFLLLIIFHSSYKTDGHSFSCSLVCVPCETL